jgi:ClpP class serine protease
MHHYMLHATDLVLTPEGRATAERNREAVFSQGSRARGGRLASFTGQIGGVSGRMHDREKLTTRFGNVAVLDINGALCSGDNDLICWMLGGVPSQWIEEDAKSLAADESVRSVIVRLNTPGGAVARFSAVAAALRALGDAKELIAVVDDAAYSMGAVLSALCSKVYVTPSGGMGNIGVIAGPFIDQTKAQQAAGVEVFYACAPDGKASGNYGTALPDEFRTNMNAAARRWYETFAGYFERRGLSIADIDGMNGAVYAAEDAVTMGLADGVATFDEVILPLITGEMPERTNQIQPAEPRGRVSLSNIATKEQTMKLTAPQWAGLTAEAIREHRPELLEAIAATGKAAEPEPAGLAELETAFKGESTFILDVLRAKETMPQAHARFAGVLADRLTAANARIAELDKSKPAEGKGVATAAQKVAEVSVVDPAKLEASGTVADPNTPKDKEAAIEAMRKEHRTTYAQAAIKARAKWPALFAA